MLARADAAIGAEADLLTPLAVAFAEHNAQLHLVGGSVRDALLGRLGHDLDFTTDARPDTIREILTAWAPAVWDTGIEFGTVSAEKAGRQVEITTFRADQYDQVSRNPEVTFGDNLNDDLIRRDFRCNAIAVQLHADGTRTFEDPLGGFDDVVAGRLDTPGAPEVSFGDDPLRMLRACRFVSQLECTVSDRVRTAMTDMAPQIERITAERVRAELDKLFLGADPARGINLMVSTGLADYVMPELTSMVAMSDEHKQHKDVYQHSLQVMRRAIAQEEPGEPDLTLRMAALLHDCGKPETREIHDNGAVTFHHHEVVGAKKARRRMRELKYPKRITNDVYQLVYLHMRFYGYGEGKWTDSAVRRYVTDAGHLLDRLNKLVRADCTTRNKKKAARLARACDNLEERIAEIAEKENLAKVRPDLDGNEIMEILDIPAGPNVGKAWKHLKDLRLDRGPMEREDAILELKNWWYAQSNPDEPETDESA
ncbi:CCA tRNA nucleotidyltransferase [Corynebacterium sp. TAE3-ERU12]|uniref:CCA tRNA nucleotidyltransferase n=1 Tax=Corynebacterium sp. TAE3-ERU12 TaxID=2849491 RepID=UPI001C44AAC7|nr:CCA tRNA nucleotidyltransferase [Corynebacterium sp. TAE3-ERU12]MBV7294330.1 CCA tRNA nucleotidyltransferase [Corynebacterium sp. TAE3-ERU12]